jgi:ADP-heptose:LPS heptosyltransferase
MYLKNNNIQIIVLTAPKNYNSIRKKIFDLNLEYVAVSYLTNTILDAAAIIKHMDLVITPDTSIVHIASAFNVPIVSIHEDNLKSYKLFAPKSDNFKTVFSKFSDKLEGYNVGKIIYKSIELLDKDES